jgi:hypothetical protein
MRLKILEYNVRATRVAVKLLTTCWLRYTCVQRTGERSLCSATVNRVLFAKSSLPAPGVQHLYRSLQVAASCIPVTHRRWYSVIGSRGEYTFFFSPTCRAPLSPLRRTRERLLSVRPHRELFETSRLVEVKRIWFSTSINPPPPTAAPTPYDFMNMRAERVGMKHLLIARPHWWRFFFLIKRLVNTVIGYIG